MTVDILQDKGYQFVTVDKLNNSINKIKVEKIDLTNKCN